MRSISKADGVSELAAKVVRRSMSILEAALGEDGDAERVRADAQLSEKEVPFYLKIAAKMGAAAAQAQAEAGNGVGHTLNVVIVQQSESREAWVKDVAAFKKSEGEPAKKVIDVEASK